MSFTPQPHFESSPAMSSLLQLLASCTPLFLLLVISVSAERVSIQAGKSFCVFDDLKANVPWGIQFQSDEHEIKTVVRANERIGAKWDYCLNCFFVDS